MAKDLNITLDEWLSELGKAEQVEGFSTEDAAERWGVSIATARARIKKLRKDGKVMHVGSRDGISIDGKRHMVPVFRKI